VASSASHWVVDTFKGNSWHVVSAEAGRIAIVFVDGREASSSDDVIHRNQGIKSARRGMLWMSR